ncbi:MAG: hypothetical protein HC907_06940 [Richelia sp. SM1_7_0]|nr:hypothetical protein [Richelia sp. SM1_7_0]
MNKHLFLIFWTLISPGCLGLIAAIFSAFKLGWNPGNGMWLLSIAIYLAYWILVGILQAGLLFWKFQDKQLSFHWFLQTSITGFIMMICHDVVLLAMGIEAVGQGALILLISLPVLAIFGGPILGFIQFLPMKDYYFLIFQSNDLQKREILWLGISLFSWVIGFGGLMFGYGVFFFVATGTLLKGWFIHKYLQV